MSGQEDIIRERFARETCGSCGTNRRREDVMILAHRTSRWMVLVACRHCHHRGIFIVTFPRDGQATAASDLSLDLRHSSSDTSESARRWENPIPSITSLPYSTAYDEPITVRDVNAMRRFLADFNGDFHALFGGEPG